MKKKALISFDEDLLNKIDDMDTLGDNRSQKINKILREVIEQKPNEILELRGEINTLRHEIDQLNKTQ